jgi:hypothetical protein
MLNEKNIIANIIESIVIGKLAIKPANMDAKDPLTPPASLVTFKANMASSSSMFSNIEKDNAIEARVEKKAIVVIAVK